MEGIGFRVSGYRFQGGGYIGFRVEGIPGWLRCWVVGSENGERFRSG